MSDEPVGLPGGPVKKRWWWTTNRALRGPLEVATWADPPDVQKRAHVVLGQTGLIKNAWGPL